jgi:hypothetical protein
MAEVPVHPYGPEARGAEQVAAEQQQLAEAYAEGLRGIESQRDLTPVQSRVEEAAPVPPPTPEPVESPMQVWVDGQRVDLSAPSPSQRKMLG